MMKLAKIITLITSVIMFCSIIYGLLMGDFVKEAAELLNITWGIITLVDISIMFLLFSLWVIYREGLSLKSMIVVLFVWGLGSLTASVYALYALITSKGNWQLFWMGKKNMS